MNRRPASGRRFSFGSPRPREARAGIAPGACVHATARARKAARLPAIMAVPLILFILPVLFIVIRGPAACSINDARMP
jgi:hypothetical protein